jgi:methionyl-tRNA formyltransferase
LRDHSVRVWQAQVESHAGAEETVPGAVLSANADGIRVATGDGALALLRLQAEGGRVMDAAAFVNGHRVHAGDRFTTVV